MYAVRDVSFAFEFIQTSFQSSQILSVWLSVIESLRSVILPSASQSTPPDPSHFVPSSET